MVKEYDSGYVALAAARKTQGAFDYDPPYPGPIDADGDHTSTAPVAEMYYEHNRCCSPVPNRPWKVKQRGMFAADFSK